MRSKSEMKREDIIRMARESGLEAYAALEHKQIDWACLVEDLERFAALVAAAEREACAKVAEAQENRVVVSHPARIEFDPNSMMARKIAAVIRTRGDGMNLREAAQQVAQQATPREQLLKELMDSRVPKTEREHAAVREIERLRAALAEGAMQRLTDVQQEMERKPLTDEEIDRVWRSVDYRISYDNFRIEVARAIERAHGIGDKNG